MRPLTLPPCLVDGAKQLFPSLNFSRVKFYYSQNAPAPVTRVYWTRTEIILNGSTPSWPKDPCAPETFALICHELVHALQGQGFLNRIIHRAATLACAILHGQAPGNSRNCVEIEAFNYEQAVLSWLKQTKVGPCNCANAAALGMTDHIGVVNPAFAASVSQSPQIVKSSAGCSPWECVGAGLFGTILGGTLATLAFVYGAAAALVDGLLSAVGAYVGGVVSGAGGAIVGAAILGPAGAMLGFILGVIIGALIGALIGAIIGWIIDFFGDDGGALNLMFSSDHGLSFHSKVSFERSCEPMSLSFGEVMVRNFAENPTSTTRPAKRLAIVWTGTDSRVNLLSLPINKQEPFRSKIAFERSEECGPAVTHLGVRLHIMWQGLDNRLNGITTNDGVATSNKYTLPTLSPDDASPATCVVNGRAILTYIGTNRQINLLSSQNGIDWGNKTTLPEEAESESTVAVTATPGNNFAIAWTGTDSGHHINIMTMIVDPTSGAMSPIGKTVLNETSATNAGPALAATGRTLLLAWTGRDGQVNFARFDKNLKLLSKLAFERSREDCGPALTVDQSGLICIGWTGTG